MVQQDMTMTRILALVGCLLLLSPSGMPFNVSGPIVFSPPAPNVFSSAGPDPASIQGAVDNFRAGLGSLNPNVSGSFGSGRREIDWEVPDGQAAPSLFFTAFYNTFSPRGVVIFGPISQVSMDDDNPPDSDPDEVRFDNINPTYSSNFQAFSARRIFGILGANVLEVNFFVPGSFGAQGSLTSATVSGFGAVFTDVDFENSTSIEIFGVDGNSLGAFFAPPANNGLSFVGVIFPLPDRVTRVRITSGNAGLSGTNNDGGPIDVVAMDDFIYGEPVVVFDNCLKDESNGNALLFSSLTGDYAFTTCAGLNVFGRGTLAIRGSVVGLQQFGPDRRVIAMHDRSVHRATAAVQLFSSFGTFTIIDRDTTDSPCGCTVGSGSTGK